MKYLLLARTYHPAELRDIANRYRDVLGDFIELRFWQDTPIYQNHSTFEINQSPPGLLARVLGFDILNPNIDLSGKIDWLIKHDKN